MRTLSRRRGQSGFTLIELLVVIVILGLLSAVVVFAVRGIGDKGQANAVATDERTIRTAEEAYCAKAGQYASMDQLTGNAASTTDGNTYKFLSEVSTYHRVDTGDDTLADKQGNCPSDPGHKHFSIACADGSAMPGCGLPGGGGGGIEPPPPVCPAPDSFCDLGAVSNTAWIVALPSGHPLAFTRDGVKEYDPASAPYGAWSGLPGDYGVAYPAVIGTRPGTPPGPNDDCSPNCGKVFGYQYAGTGSWALYDPVTHTKVLLPSPSDPGSATSGGHPNQPSTPAQILGRDCAPYCGQFLLTYSLGPGPCCSPPFAELWNPKTLQFTPVGTILPGSAAVGNSPTVVALSDGRVLVTSNRPYRWTRYFTPAASNPPSETSFSGGPSDYHLVEHGLAKDRAVLANGDVLFVYGSQAEVFLLNPPPNESPWKLASSCATPDAPWCRLLTAFAGGQKVLAVSASDLEGPSKKSYLFDATSGKWTPTTGVPTRQDSMDLAAVIGGGTTHLGAVVTVSGGVNAPDMGGSQLYIPPS